MRYEKKIQEGEIENKKEDLKTYKKELKGELKRLNNEHGHLDSNF